MCKISSQLVNGKLIKYGLLNSIPKCSVRQVNFVIEM